MFLDDLHKFVITKDRMMSGFHFCCASSGGRVFLPHSALRQWLQIIKEQSEQKKNTSHIFLRVLESQ